MAHSPKDSIRIWCPEGIQGLELMDARVQEHRWPRHFHEAYAIGFNLAGVGAFFCRGSMQVPVFGSLHLLNPQDIHTGQAAGDGVWWYRSFHLSPEFIEALSERVEGRPRPLSFREPLVQDQGLSASLGQLFEAVDDRQGHGVADAFERESWLLLALGQVMQRYADLRPAVTGPERKVVRQLKACLQDRFQETVTLGELSTLVGLTPHHVIEVFQRETGVPPHAYLNLLRVNRAKGLLRQGRPIAEVAQACGYCDQSHLNRWFRKVLGLTPRQYQSAGLSSKNR